MRRAALITGLAGAVVLALTWAAIATARGLPATLPRHLLFYVAAGVAWAAAARVVTRLPASRAQLVIVALVALALRVPAWMAAPAHSDDVYRYMWDGKVQREGINPYRYRARGRRAAPVYATTGGGTSTIASLPTIYPPLAEAAFAAAPSLGAWKLVVALADAAVALLLYIGLADRRRVVLWAWSPLVVMELGMNAHVDALGDRAAGRRRSWRGSAGARRRRARWSRRRRR